MTRITVVALVVLVGTTARGADPVADETKKLQGEWHVVGTDARGNKVGRDDPQIKDMRFTFKDSGLTVGFGGAARKKSFKVDPGKSPKHIDITSLDGQEKDTTAACIYKLDGDRLTICIPYFSKDPTVRPKEFKAGADDGLMLVTLERAPVK